MTRSICILAIAVLSLGFVEMAAARTKTPIGSHIPEIRNPFAFSEAVWQSLFVATTPGGQTLSARQLSQHVLQVKWPTNTIPVLANWHLKIGVFLLHVRGDGTVSDVEVLQPIGHPTATRDCIKAFKQWRFRPNSVKAVRIPAYYTRV